MGHACGAGMRVTKFRFPLRPFVFPACSERGEYDVAFHPCYDDFCSLASISFANFALIFQS